MFGKPSSDLTLVKRALKGKADAWDKLIRRYEPKIFNFALRMTGNHEDARDLMQEVFIAVYRNLESYGQKAAFSSWIFTIASRRATDFYRRRKPVDPMGESDADLSDDRYDPHDDLLRYESNREIQHLLRQLSPDQRMVVELKIFQEMTFEEMANSVDIPINTLKSRFYGALRKLKSLPEVCRA